MNYGGWTNRITFEAWTLLGGTEETFEGSRRNPSCENLKWLLLEALKKRRIDIDSYTFQSINWVELIEHFKRLS